MKKFFLFLILIVDSTYEMSGQSMLGNEWITGRGSKVKFVNNTITTKYNVLPGHYFSKGNSGICDTNGRLMLCSDGYNIYDSSIVWIDGGDTLVPKDYYDYQDGWSNLSQTSIFLPMDSQKYYFVTPAFSDSQYADCNLNGNCYFDLLLYNVVDMNANGGAGKVVKRMVPLMEHAQLRKTQMMACRHGNGKDWWLLNHEGDSNRVHKFLFTQDSVFNFGQQVFGSPVWGQWDIYGGSAFNSAGTMYTSSSHAGGISGEIFIADFNRCDGLLSNSSIITRPWGSLYNPNDTSLKEKMVKALAFSPNGKLLYVIGMTNIYQYDLDSATWYHVAGMDTSWTYFADYDASYYGADGKLYIGNFHTTSKQMSRIDNPDGKGAACNFCPRCLRLDSLGIFAAAGTPPCMPNFNLGKDSCFAVGVIDYTDDDNHLTVWPNPANTVLYIKPIEAHKKKELFNSIGQLLFTTRENEIHISQYSRGVYCLKVQDAVRKVIFD